MSFTVCEETEYEVTMSDIIGNLGEFSNKDLEKLQSELIQYLSIDIKTPNTLYEEMKFAALNIVYEKYSLDELDELIKNKK